MIAARYGLPPWEAAEKRAHKAADIAAAAAEAVFVAGWTRKEVRETLGIRAPVNPDDPLVARYGGEPWRAVGARSRGGALFGRADTAGLRRSVGAPQACPVHPRWCAARKPSPAGVATTRNSRALSWAT